jgi:hypothetical protein
MDIVVRLRTAATNYREFVSKGWDASGNEFDQGQKAGDTAIVQMLEEAADEIERLRAVVQGQGRVT